MRLILSSDELRDVFIKNMDTYGHFYCSVAWAGDPTKFIVGNKIIKNLKKINKAIVGLHFYQTHPDFIEKFIGHKGVRFIKETDGVFHDKIYLFVNSPEDWVAIVGSSNLTSGGFIKNSECNVVFSNKDDVSGELFKSLIERIETNWGNSFCFNEKELANYKEIYNLQSRRRDGLSKVRKSYAHTINGSELLLMTWEEFYAKIQQYEGLETRINVLKTAQSLFKSTNHFFDLDELDKKKICGYRLKKAEEWCCFGTINNGQIRSAMLEKRIGQAIDGIPLKGKVKKSQFEKYVSIFLNVGNWKDPIASVTRLLAIKRPDIFICVNGQNKAGLAKGLNIPQNNITLDNYWDEIIVPIQNAIWYNGSPQGSSQQNIYKNRVALLDLFYIRRH